MDVKWCITWILLPAAIVWVVVRWNRGVDPNRAEIHALVDRFAQVVVASFALVCLRSYVGAWPLPAQILVWPVAASLIYLFARSGRLPAFAVPSVSADQLGFIRVCVALALLVLAFKDDISTTLIVPQESAYYWTGPFQYLFKIYPQVFALRSPVFLAVIAWGTRVSLLFVLFGIFTRYSVVAGAVFFSLFYYVQILYTHFYTSGYLALILLYALAFMPCGDGFSFDAWKKRGTVFTDLTGPDYALSAFGCYAAYGLSYYICALSKWRLDSYWAASNNMVRYIGGDAAGLIDQTFGLDLAPEYIRMGGPVLIFGILGSIALVSESSGIFILFFRRARYAVPAALACFHCGTYLLQKFIFPDMVLLAFMFAPLDAIRSRLSRGPVSGFASSFPAFAPVARTARRGVAFAASFLCAHVLSGWATGIKVFPLSNPWDMYAASGYAETTWYTNIYLNLRSGVVVRTDLTDEIDFLGHAKWQGLAYWPRDDAEKVKIAHLFASYARVYNSKRAPEDRIASIDLVYFVWDFVNDPRNPTHGNLEKSMRFDVVYP